MRRHDLAPEMILELENTSNLFSLWMAAEFREFSTWAENLQGRNLTLLIVIMHIN